MPAREGTLLLLRDIAKCWSMGQLEGLAAKLRSSLNQPVEFSTLDSPFAPLTTAMQQLAMSHVQVINVLPLGLLPVPGFGEFPQTMQWAKQQWPSLKFRMAAPLTWSEWARWVQVLLSDAARPSGVPLQETGLLLLGREFQKPLLNADLPRLAHLIRESRMIPHVEHAFPADIPPGLEDSLARLAKEGAQRIFVFPWLISDSTELSKLRERLGSAADGSSCKPELIDGNLAHSSLTNVLAANLFAAVPEEEFRQTLGTGCEGQPASATETSISPEDAYELRMLEERLQQILPPEYQGRYEDVSPKSMGTASLKYDEAGRVAWDQIWTSFCDLAIAGGPPHRGKLLEAVTTEEVQADPARYLEVVQEIERGIQLVTGLPVVTSASPGWVGVRCESEEMAVWLMRAIIVENIMVRRENEVIYLPAGPQFTIKREIKNVITAIAKTVHYWSAHLLARRQNHSATTA